MGIEGRRLQIGYYRPLTAMGPTCECRLRLWKQQGWEVREIGPFPAGSATLSPSSRSLDQIQKAPTILPRHESRPQHPAGTTVPNPHSGFTQDPPRVPHPRGDTEEDPDFMQDSKAKLRRSVGRSVTDLYPQTLWRPGNRLNLGRSATEGAGPINAGVGPEMEGSGSLREGGER